MHPIVQVHQAFGRKYISPSARQLVFVFGIVNLIFTLAPNQVGAIVKQSTVQAQQSSQQQQQQQQSQQTSSQSQSQGGPVVSLSQASSSAIRDQQQQQQQLGRNDEPQSQAYGSSNQYSVYPPSSQAGPSQSSGSIVGLTSSSNSLSSGASSPSLAVSSTNPSSSLGNQNQASLQQNSKATYYDNLSVSASDQSYQAAANSVNLALANSGLYSGYGSGSANNVAGGGISSGSNSPSSGQQAQQPQYQNIHYLYYPPKEGSSSSSSSSSGSSPASSSSPIIAKDSNTAYQQFSSAYDQMIPMASNQADALTSSNQDQNYMNSNSGINGPNSQPIDASNLYQQQAGSNHYLQNAQDLSAYANQMSPVQVANPSQNQGQQSLHYQSQQHQSNLNSNSQSNQNGGNVQFQSQSDSSPSYLSSQGYQSSIGNNVQQIQASASSQSQSSQNNNNIQGQNSNYNQLGDLFTSNYGSPSISSPVASYMLPSTGHQDQYNSGIPQQQQQQQQLHRDQQHLQSNSLFGQSGLLNSLGSQSNGASVNSNAALFPNAAYLNSLLQSPQFASQYAQFSGQANDLGGSNSPGQLVASASQPMGSISSATSTAAVAKKYGLSSFIMPMLALAGLSLLIPTMSNIGTAVGRKKRSIAGSGAGDDKASLLERQQQILYESMHGLANQLTKEMAIGEYIERIERYYALYKNAAQNDDCMNRLICEFGDSVKDVSGKGAIITIIEKLVPNWMVGKVHLFREAAMDAKEGREKCKRYTCHHDKRSSLH